MAGNRELYERTHQGIGDRTFETIKDNLLYLSERKVATGSGRPLVTLINVVFSENAEGLADFVEFAGAVKADRISFQPFDDMNDPGLSRLVPKEAQAVSVRKQLLVLRDYIESRKIGHNIDFFLRSFREKIDTAGLYQRIRCYIGWLWTLFKPDGEVYPCCGCYSPLGNVYETGFNEIWNGQAYREFRRKAILINSSGAPVDGCRCDSCPHYTLNMKAYEFFHPVKGRSARLKDVLHDGFGAGEES